MLPLEVVFLAPSKPFESLRPTSSVYFGMIIASGDPPGRDARVPFIDQLRHYSMFDQKTGTIDPVLFDRRRPVGQRLSPMPADG